MVPHATTLARHCPSAGIATARASLPLKYLVQCNSPMAHGRNPISAAKSLPRSSTVPRMNSTDYYTCLLAFASALWVEWWIYRYLDGWTDSISATTAD